MENDFCVCLLYFGGPYIIFLPPPHSPLPRWTVTIFIEKMFLYLHNFENHL